jgi:hypothetical protein
VTRIPQYETFVFEGGPQNQRLFEEEVNNRLSWDLDKLIVLTKRLALTHPLQPGLRPTGSSQVLPEKHFL